MANYDQRPNKHLLLQQDLSARQTYDGLPESLTDGHLFCVWKYETRDGELTKMPYSPNNYGNTSTRAKSNDPATFADFKTAREFYNAYPFDGMGIGFFGNLAGIDIDHCIDRDAGTISPLAMRIATTINSYTEVSPSGDGLHIIFEVTSDFRDAMAIKISKDMTVYKSMYFHKNSPKATGVEVYIAGATNRFFTLTGKQINLGNGGIVRERTTQLRGILDEYMKRPERPAQPAPAPSTPLDIDDQEIIERAKKARNGATFAALWRGDISGYGSRSEADLALCNMLSFWTGRDAERIDRLFRQSGLMRDKWEREDYRNWTITKAIDGTVNAYEPKKDAAIGAPGAGRQEQPEPQPQPQQVAQAQKPASKSATELFDDFLHVIKTDTYRPYQTGIGALDRLLGGGIVKQSLVVLTAAPGTGKTALASQIAESIARSGQDVVYLNLEMSREYMLARSLSRITPQYGYPMTASEIMRGYKWSADQAATVEQAAKSYRDAVAPHMNYNPDGCDNSLERLQNMLDGYLKNAKEQHRMAPPVVLDYLHLVTSVGRMDAQDVVKQVVATLKDYAIDGNTFVVAIAATNRASNMAGKQTQSSARDSSAIEYTADIQIGLNFTAFVNKWTNADGKLYNPESPDDMDEILQQNPRKMVVQVLKNRMNQPGGKQYFDFYAAQSMFIATDNPDKP